ncbi:MAG: hypothetical protein U5R06_15240 [candidate division KSB1 bacterium]|nr:hypothetical protein [candidate division KSB1 bacterium]
MKSNLKKLICCVCICFLLTCVIDLNAQYVFYEYGDTTYIDVGNDKQLFIDDFLIDLNKHIDFVMNPPYQTGEIIIDTDLPHEKDGLILPYSSVIKDKDGKIRIWYDLTIPALENVKKRTAGYAESNNGIDFKKPVLGKYEVKGSKKNNIVFPPEANGGTAVWIDPMALAEHRYKTQSKVYPSKELHIYSSPDGIDWSFYANVDPRDGPVDTQTIIFWDKNLGKYLLFTRERIYGRCVRRAEMNDLESSLENTGFAIWTDIKDQYTYFSERADRSKPEDLRNDAPMGYYGATIFPYENVYIGLAQAFWHWKGRGEHDLRPGMRDVRLLISRDSKEFKRMGNRKAFMGPGPSGRFDSKCVWALPNPIVMGDEIWIYYVGWNFDRIGRIDPDAPDGMSRSVLSRAIMRLDGFVSADAPYEGGEMITKPITFKGNKLEINANTGAGGSIRVEILDHDGYPIPGFSIEESNWIVGNSVRFPVSWTSDGNLESLNGKIVRLRFVMRDCKLYAFQFK